MKSLSFLIKPASSLCNMRCKYCFYADIATLREVKSFGIMKEETTNKLIKQAFSSLDEKGQVVFAFQGGEPTMAGLDYFKHFIQIVNQYKKSNQQVRYAIQTNGLIIDEEWSSFFHQHQFLVGISLDGPKDNHDYLRVDTQHKETFLRIMKTIDLLKKHRIEFNILTVLTNTLAKHPKKLYDFYRKHDLHYIQLIPCLNGLEDKHQFSLTPELYASFFDRFFQEWLVDFQHNIFRSINLFDNIIPMLIGQRPYQCGLLGYCSPQFVIEADGSVYPCDFYVLDQYNCGNIQEKTIDELFQSPAMNRFLTEKKEVFEICKNCPYECICHGGCKRQRDCFVRNDFCGYRVFLDHNIHEIEKIARTIVY